MYSCAMRRGNRTDDEIPKTASPSSALRTRQARRRKAEDQRWASRSGKVVVSDMTDEQRAAMLARRGRRS